MENVYNVLILTEMNVSEIKFLTWIFFKAKSNFIIKFKS